MITNFCLLAVTGGSASGKTRLAQAVAGHFAAQACYVIPEDDYYVDAGNMPGFDPAVFNFDEPAAKQHDLLAAHLDALRDGRSIETPQYDFATHCRCHHTIRRSPARVMIVEGLHLLTNPALAAVFDLTVFVDASDEIRFKRRLARDVAERGRTPESVYHQFETLVRPMHDAHVEPQKARAQLVIENMGQPDFVALAQPVISQIEARLQVAQSA
jgi:uridine kinase